MGKTELAKALAEFLFDDERSLIRIDMSEYMEKHSVARMIGAPPGYVGYEEGGQLSEAIRRRPYSVVLFDEIEKAHRDANNVLLQVLDDGRLTDGQGRTIDFRNTVLIMTSNVASPLIQDFFQNPESERDESALRQMVERELARLFRPEFLNRIDDRIIFQPLSATDLNAIVAIQLRLHQERLRQRQLEIEFAPEVAELLVKAGYDPQFGARPLKRAIQSLILDPLALQLLERELPPGTKIKSEVIADEIKFNIENP